MLLKSIIFWIIGVAFLIAMAIVVIFSAFTEYNGENIAKIFLAIGVVFLLIYNLIRKPVVAKKSSK